jgi:hypothetical protein
MDGAGLENAQALRNLLDGEVERRVDGFDCTTAARTLFVPYNVTRDVATALAICKERGLLIEKLEAMTAAQADVLFATTIAQPLAEN